VLDEPNSAPGGRPTAATESLGGRPRKLSAMEQARISVRVGMNESLAEVVYQRCGGNHTKAMHVMGFVSVYGVFVEQNGREPRSLLELASTVKGKRSRATIDRWAQQFREAFPEYTMPAVLWSMVRDSVQADDPDVVSMQIGAVIL
jgi:hypothetical protein